MNRRSQCFPILLNPDPRTGGDEPVDMTGSTATDVILNLPSGADNAQLRDIGGGNLRLESTDTVPTFEQTDFAAPSGSITINGGAGDTVTVSGALNIGTADLAITADTIELGAGPRLHATGSV